MLGTLHNAERVARLSLGLQYVVHVDYFFEWAWIVLCLGKFRALVFGYSNGVVKKSLLLLLVHLIGFLLFSLALNMCIRSPPTLVRDNQGVGRYCWYGKDGFICYDGSGG